MFQGILIIHRTKIQNNSRIKEESDLTVVEVLRGPCFVREMIRQLI